MPARRVTPGFVSHSPSPQALRALLDKYAEIERLRRAPVSSEAPRAELRALARRFPGSLRELDCRSLEDLERRCRALSAALATGAPAPPWAAAQIAYHGALRAALRIRQAARPLAGDAAAVQAWLVQNYHPAWDEPAPERLDGAIVEQLLRPPGGRIHRWTLAWVARELQLEPERVEAALFGHWGQ